MSGQKIDEFSSVAGQEGYPGGTVSQEGYVPKRKGYLATSGHKPKSNPPKVENVKFVPKNPPKAD